MLLDKVKNVITFEEEDIKAAKDFAEMCDIYDQVQKLHNRHSLLSNRLEAELRFVVDKDIRFLEKNELAIFVNESTREIELKRKKENPLEDLFKSFGDIFSHD